MKYLNRSEFEKTQRGTSDQRIAKSTCTEDVCKCTRHLAAYSIRNLNVGVKLVV